MKLRWSNGKDYAENFEANDLTSFQHNGLEALRVFRAATYRQVHRGETHQNQLWWYNDSPQLHMRVADSWLAPGHIKHTDSGFQCFVPFAVQLPQSAADLDDIFAKDRQVLERSGDMIWQGVYDCWRWSRVLDDLSTTIVDSIDNLSTATTPSIPSQAAAILGSRTSEAKAAAARANGRKGGRPRKQRQE